MATRKQTDQSVPFSNAIVEFAKARNMSDLTKAGKALRSRVRGHRAELESLWPALSDHSKGDRYNTIPRRALTAVVSNDYPQSK